MKHALFDQNIDLTRFILESIYRRNMSPIFPLLHPDIVWIGAAENQYIKGYSRVKDYLCQLSDTYTCHLVHHDYHILPISQTAYAVTGYCTSFTNHACDEVISRDQRITCIWTMYHHTFHVLHMHVSSPLEIQNPEENSPLFFHGKNGVVHIISPKEIVYLEADNINCKICCHNQCFISCHSLRQAEDILPDYFIRVHRSFIVNIGYVHDLSRYMLTLKDGTTLPIPEKRYMNVKQILTDKLPTHNLSHMM